MPMEAAGHWCKNKSFPHGRVLVVDHVKVSSSNPFDPSVIVHEINNEPELKTLFLDKSHSAVIFRLIHVQNAPWAHLFLKTVFKLNDQNFPAWNHSVSGSDHWNQRLLQGKTFGPHLDPRRKTVGGGFVVDYLQPITSTANRSESGSSGTGSAHQGRADDGNKLLDLSHPADKTKGRGQRKVYFQRLCVYTQYRRDDLVVLPQPDDGPRLSIHNNGGRARSGTCGSSSLDVNFSQDGGTLPRNWSIDSGLGLPGRDFANNSKAVRPDRSYNGNAVIFFGDSHNGSLVDSLIPARSEIERCLILSFVLPGVDITGAPVAALTLVHFQSVVNKAFLALRQSWLSLIDQINYHISVLQADIHRDPTYEARCAEILKNTKYWIVVSQLAAVHISLLSNINNLLSEITSEEGIWIDTPMKLIDGIPALIQEFAVKPTGELQNQLNTATQMRDTRKSLQLGVNLGRHTRLSSLVLAAGFIVSIFALYSDSIPGSTVVKWLFVTIFPVMIVAISVWKMFKPAAVVDGRSSFYRHEYQDTVNVLATRYPHAWTDQGPLLGECPAGFLNAIKWRLMKRWFCKVEHSADMSTDNRKFAASLDLVTRIKFSLARWWTERQPVVAPPIERPPTNSLAMLEAGQSLVSGNSDGNIIYPVRSVESPSLAPAVQIIPALQFGEAQPDENATETTTSFESVNNSSRFTWSDQMRIPHAIHHSFDAPSDNNVVGTDVDTDEPQCIFRNPDTNYSPSSQFRQRHGRNVASSSNAPIFLDTAPSLRHVDVTRGNKKDLVLKPHRLGFRGMIGKLRDYSRDIISIPTVETITDRALDVLSQIDGNGTRPSTDVSLAFVKNHSI